MSLDPKVKDVWVKALRSGKYRQGRFRLKAGNQHGTFYCPLGVLREVSPVSLKTLNEFGYPKQAYLSNGYVIGLDMGTQIEIAKMNDGRTLHDGYPLKELRPKDFDTIANYIEKRL